MNSRLLVEKYAKEQKLHFKRVLKPMQRALLHDFINYIKKVDVTVDGDEVADAIDKDIRSLVEPLEYKHDKRLNFAIITEEVGHLTGGRYYTWFIAMALCELGHKVTVYTNQKPVFHADFASYKQPDVEVITSKAYELESIDVEADVYIGSPISGNIAVSRLGEKYHKPSYAIVFDPFPMMDRFIGKRKYPGWEGFISSIQNSSTKIISLCNSTSEYIYDWLNKRPDQVIPIYPCINSNEKEEAEKLERGDYVVFMSRLVKHKRFEHVLDAVKTTSVKLKVISSIDGVQAKRIVHEKGMDDRVEWHFKVSDKEKFSIIKGARAVINAAVFEGFGIWATEAHACGVPLVCYDFPTLREIAEVSKADNFYFAEWDNPRDLERKLHLALSEQKYREDSEIFGFHNLVKRVDKIFRYEPRIGVVTIAINEQKFIGASLRSVIKHPNIKKVAVVEGAVNLYAHACNDSGLSVDNTQSEVIKVMDDKFGNKIVYERYGWANDKSELRNRALELLGRDLDYILVVDGDEVWRQEDLDNLVEAMRANPQVGVFRFPFYHFWKSKNQIAVGSQWESFLFRCFKYTDKSLRWRSHEKPVIDSKGRQIDKTAGAKVLNNVHVYHYGYMKDDKDVKAKLEFYKKRDKHLNVVDTFTKWRKGKSTQPTHGGGTVSSFKGNHPNEVEGII
jgi:glycosyltransferase involved in cell wall biosynthesis